MPVNDTPQFRPLEELRADPQTVDLDEWSGLVLRVKSMANNNDTLESIAICESVGQIHTFIDYAFGIEDARWNGDTPAQFPFVLLLEPKGPSDPRS